MPLDTFDVHTCIRAGRRSNFNFLLNQENLLTALYKMANELTVLTVPYERKAKRKQRKSPHITTYIIL